MATQCKVAQNQSLDYGKRRKFRLDRQTEYHAADDTPKLTAAVVDVETTGTNPDRDKIIELGLTLFEYARHDGRIYRVLARIMREGWRM